MADRLDGMVDDNSTTEVEWKSSTTSDYMQRLCGHCNTNTDIKVHFGFKT